MKSVWLPAMNDGRKPVCLDRSTTTWNAPLAASYRLSDVIDFSSGGWLRTVVVVRNGFRSWGSRWTAAAASSSAMTAMVAATTAATRPSSRPERQISNMLLLGAEGP